MNMSGVNMINTLNSMNTMNTINPMHTNLSNMPNMSNISNMQNISDIQNMMNGNTSVNCVMVGDHNMVQQVTPIPMNTMNTMNINGQPTQIIMAPMAFANTGTMLALTPQGLQNVTTTIPSIGIPAIPMTNVMPSLVLLFCP